MGDRVEPSEISNRLKVEFPDDGSMRISHEAIYQALSIGGGRYASRGSGRGTNHKATSPQAW